MHQLDLVPVVLEERRQPAPDAEIDAGDGIARVGAVHVVALFVGDHLERQLVVVAQEHGPLAAVGRLRRLAQDVDDREAVFHAQAHEQARHQREVERHLALVAVAEVRGRVLGPLVRLGEEHAVGEAAVDRAADLLQEVVRLLEVLAARALALEQVRHRVEAQPVDTHLEPVLDRAQHLAPDLGVVEVEVGLVRVETVPVVLGGDVVPRPVGPLEVAEDDARVAVARRLVAPHVPVAIPAAARRAAGPLEPRVLVGGVVQHELGDDAQVAAVRLVEEAAELAEVAVRGIDAAVVGDVVALVAQRRRVEGQQPDRRDAEVLEVVELAGQPAEVADAVAVAVGEGAHVQLVHHRVAVPRRVGDQLLAAAEQCRRAFGHGVTVSPAPARSTAKTCAGTAAGSSCTKLVARASRTPRP